jgi:hypothetical protein
MGQEASSSDEALPNFEGEMTAAPRGPLATAALAITGILLIVEVARLVARYVLVLRRPTEVRLTASGIEVRGRTFMVGKLLREHATVIPRDGLVRVTREVRYPSLAMYAGLIALALGSYVGVGLVVDGVRAASPSMLGTGLLIALIGLGLDFVLSVLVPGLNGKSRVVLVPRRGPIVCVTAVDPARADALLAELAKVPSVPLAKSRPAVETAAGADRTADEAERKSAGDAR